MRISEFLCTKVNTNVLRLTQQTAEGNGRSELGEVNEEDGSEALRVEAVPDVAHVLRVSETDSLHNIAEKTCAETHTLVTRVFVVFIHTILDLWWVFGESSIQTHKIHLRKLCTIYSQIDK